MACGGGSRGAEKPGGGEIGGDSSGAGAGLVLVSVSADGGACRVVVRDEAGAEQQHGADAALCPGGASDASGLIGKSVQLRMGDAPGAPSLPAGEDPCRDIAPPCGGDASGGGKIVVAITAA